MSLLCVKSLSDNFFRQTLRLSLQCVFSLVNLKELHRWTLKGELCTRFWWGNLKERDHWGDQDVDGRRRGRRRKQLMDNLKETRRYWKLKDLTLWRTGFGRGYDELV